MDESASTRSERRRWQEEADLLADGRELLERRCRSTRYRYLYLGGPNLALLLLAYQELDRQREVGLVGRRRRAVLRRFRWIIRRRVRQDARTRSLRLAYRFPTPRLHRLPDVPAIVGRALDQIDPDARPLVEALVGIHEEGLGAIESGGSRRNEPHGAALRGLSQFRIALLHECLRDPAAIVRLHPQYIGILASSLPLRRRHPIATLLFVRLPLQLLFGLFLLFSVAYACAYVWFNDEVLGRFLSDRISRIIDGDLELERVHWSGRLIFDLVTGTPHVLDVEGVDVWEAYKSLGQTRLRKTASAEHVRLSLVLHEIIPWNRLGIPTVFEIPWVLHFGEADFDRPLVLNVREYEVQYEAGRSRRFVSLRDAFIPFKPPLVGGYKGLSVQVDRAQLGPTELELDITGTTDWGAKVALRDARFDLTFDAPEVNGGPVDMPLHFDIEGHGDAGAIWIGELDLPITDVTLRRFRSNRNDVSPRDIQIDMDARVAGSPLTFAGSLDDVLPRMHDRAAPTPMGLDLAVRTDDAGPLLSLLCNVFGVEPGSVIAEGSSAAARISGPMRDPVYQLQADGVTLDVMGDSAWAADDVSFGLRLATEAPPSTWSSRFSPIDERYVLTIEHLHGSILDGTVDQGEGSIPPHVVFPIGNEPMLIAGLLELDGLNPARMLPHGAFAEKLNGAMGGAIKIRSLVLDRNATGSPIQQAVVELAEIKVRRDRGPQQDGLPRALGIDGVVRLREDGDFDIQDLSLTTDGTRLDIEGGIGFGLLRLRNLILDLTISDGLAFAQAFDLPRYFSRVKASLGLNGFWRDLAGEGRVSVDGLLDTSATNRANLRVRRGVLEVQVDNANVLGGRGQIELAVRLMDDEKFLSEPKIGGLIRLRDLDLGQLQSKAIRGRTDVELEISDGSGQPAKLADLRIDGVATSPSLELGGTIYSDAAVAFRLYSHELAIRQLILPIHRPVSPRFSGRVTVPVGRVTAEGTITIEDDPMVDLVVGAEGVPLSVVARLLHISSPIRGQIGKGTKLTVAGRVSEPSVEGHVALDGLTVNEIALGSGRLDVTSEDVEAVGPLLQHREVRVSGEVSAPVERPRRATGRNRRPEVLQWTLDAVLAVGKPRAGGATAIAAQVGIDFRELSIPTLLLDPSDPDVTPWLDGRLFGASAQVLTCDVGPPMLSDCIREHGDALTQRSLAIDLSLDRAWVRRLPKGGQPGLDGDPCLDPTTLCAANPLRATLNWPIVELDEPWRIMTGGKTATSLMLSGRFDLSAPSTPPSRSDASEASAAAECRPPLIAPPELEDDPGGQPATGARIQGMIDLRALAGVLEGAGLGDANGQLDLNVQIDDQLQSPNIVGSATLRPANDRGLVLTPPQIAIPIEFRQLALVIDRGWIAGRGAIESGGGTIEFGSLLGEHTGFAVSGACAGAFGVAAHGRLSGDLIAQALKNKVVKNGGGIEVERFNLEGRLGDTTRIQRLEGALGFGQPGTSMACTTRGANPVGSPHVLTLQFEEGITDASFDCGRIQFERCDRGRCGEVPNGWYKLQLGGATDSETIVPTDALRLVTGGGRALAWGSGYIAPALDQAEQARFRITLDDVPYRSFDGRGRLAYEAELSSDAITFAGGQPLVVTGNVSIDRSRYVKDAIESVEFLTVTEEVETASAPPPPILEGLQLELNVQTDRPLRIDNNIASGVQADLAVDVGGTFAAPEFTGRLEVEHGGAVDIPFLTGTYEIQHGRVVLLRRFEDAEVDVLALRREPVYIDNEPARVHLVLGGTLRAIHWGCIAEGEARSNRELESVRACTEYLVLGTGDVQLSEADVVRFGGAGLSGARKPLQVVGHLTEINVGERIAEAAPRLRTYVPYISFRLGQIGPEFELATQNDWFQWDWGRLTLAWDYTRGYPGFFLRQSRELSIRFQVLEAIRVEFQRRNRSYLNNRVVFDPLQQLSLEFSHTVEVPSLR